MRLILAAILFAAPTVVIGQDLEEGKALAERWCATCHAVDGGPATDAGPTFRTLARLRDDAALAGWMSAPPHGGMPDPGLSREQVASLVAWIGSLRE